MTATDAGDAEGMESTRRDFLYVATGAVGVVGAAAAAWPFIDQMNPSADVLATSTTELDISQIELGQTVTAMWRGKPVFVFHRTEAQIAEARAGDGEDLPDPQSDADRVINPEWLIVVGVCTHLGCIPLFGRGDYGAWFCPCHGSHYDKSGRIRLGPAPLNLEVPPYKFVDETTVLIG